MAGQEGAEGSVLSFWQDLLNLRTEGKDSVYGRFEMVNWESEDIYAYTRVEEEKFFVVCSFCENEVHWRCLVKKEEVILAICEVGDSGREAGVMRLKPYECRLYRRRTI